jgi:hypothetical protein
MPIETILCENLGIRFVDARNLTIEAKINLDFIGYPSAKQEKELLEEATKIFERTSDQVKRAARKWKTDLDEVRGRVKDHKDDGSISTSLTTVQSSICENRRWRSRFQLWTARKA